MQVIGASFDKPEKNAAFVAAENFQFALWSDLGRELALYYGAAKSKQQLFANRITVVLDPKGDLALSYPQPAIDFDPYNHPATVLQDLKILLAP